MSRVKVREYDDLAKDGILHTKSRDVVLKELRSGTDAVLWLEEWLVDEKDLDVLGETAGLEQLAGGRVIRETEKAYLFSTTAVDEESSPSTADPGTDWVPKSATRLYVAPDDPSDVDVSTPQSGLDAFEGGSP